MFTLPVDEPEWVIDSKDNYVPIRVRLGREGRMHSLMKIELLFIALVVAVIFSGCASTNSFNKIPTEVSSFQLPKDQLKQQYPDIQEYENEFRGLNVNTPLVQELIDAWGEPDKKKIRISYPLV